MLYLLLLSACLTASEIEAIHFVILQSFGMILKQICSKQNNEIFCSSFLRRCLAVENKSWVFEDDNWLRVYPFTFTLKSTNILFGKYRNIIQEQQKCGPRTTKVMSWKYRNVVPRVNQLCPRRSVLPKVQKCIPRSTKNTSCKYIHVIPEVNNSCVVSTQMLSQKNRNVVPQVKKIYPWNTLILC